MDKIESVLHIVISLETGGLEKFVLDLINATQNKFKHKIICLERIGELATTSVLADIICLDMAPGIQFRTILDICTIIRDYRINILHTHNERAQFYGAISGLLCRIPVIHTKHGKNLVTFKSLFRNNIISRFCTKIVAVSCDAATQCIAEEKISKSKVITILNGVDTECFSTGRDVTDLREYLKIGSGVVLIGIVARLAKVKDHETLFAACRILKEMELKFKLLVVGDGPLMDDLVALSSAMDLDDFILFTGLRHDISDILNLLDIFVLSSTSEGISLTLLEAMSCCLPIVATNVGGNPEVVVEGKTGFLVPPKMPDAMADKLHFLINNESLRLEMGVQARMRVIDLFSILKSAEKYIELYNSVCES